jgi:CBS domain-containing protein
MVTATTNQTTMRKHEPITKIMSTNLVTVHHGDPVSKVRQLAAERGVHHIPVVSGDQLVGIISWSDILRLNFGDTFQTDQRTVDATLDHTFTLEQIMQKNPITLSDTASVRDAAEILARGEFHAVPVVNGTKLVGIVSTTDLINHLLEQL